jgi:hypothetical protein
MCARHNLKKSDQVLSLGLLMAAAMATMTREA